ncbi:zinc finger protein without children isoform X2 [Arctopsyche grandis]|uniref:zinc finger protein without children isoform X2 n=1 Tax=Arctopsyche grandis TaxID=121162 RepID=UPI00406D7C63
MDEKEPESALVQVTETTSEVADSIKADLITLPDCPPSETCTEVSVKPIETAEEASASKHSNNIDDDKISNEVLSVKDTEEACKEVNEDPAYEKSNTKDVDKSSVADFPFESSAVVENNLDHSSPVNSIDCESQIENSVTSEIPENTKQCDNVISENVKKDVPIDNSVSELNVSKKDEEAISKSTEKIDNAVVDDEKIDDAVVDKEKIDAVTEDVKIDNSDGKDEQIGNDFNEDNCDDPVNVEEKVEKEIIKSVKLNQIVDYPVSDDDAGNENESNKDANNQMEVDDRTEVSEVRQNGPDGSPDNNEMDYDEKENKIEKMDIDESIVEDMDTSKDKHAENPLEETPNESETPDPFDNLLNDDKNDHTVSSTEITNIKEFDTSENDVDANNDHDMDDGNDHDADDNVDHDTDAGNDLDANNEHDESNLENDALLDDDHTHVDDDILCDNINEADIVEGEGADEEVCLLPDTDREITEADKLKALSAKKSTDAVLNANAFDSLLSDGASNERSDTGTEDTDKAADELKDEFITDTNDVQVSATKVKNIEHIIEDDAEDEELRDHPDTDKGKDDEDEPEPEPEPVADTSGDSNIIREVKKSEENCIKCDENKFCIYRLTFENELRYLCGSDCLVKFQEQYPNKYKTILKKVIVSEILSEIATCMHCSKEKECYYRFISDDKVKYVCVDECIKAIVEENPNKYTVKRKRKMVHEVSPKAGTCFWCTQSKDCILETTFEGDQKHLCSVMCLVSLQNVYPSVFRIKRHKVVKTKQPPLLKLKVISNATDKYLDEGNKIIAKTQEEADAARADRDKSFFRKCAQCQEPYVGNDKNLSWETMDFCNEVCLGKYQNTHGLHCANCKNAVSMVSLGKYCVRFGYDIRQFCCSACLDEFKKGLKICCYCQKDISVGFDGFLAPVGDQGQFKDFCSQFCVEKFDEMSKNPIPLPVWAQCGVCSKEKPTTLEVSLDEKNPLRLCSEPCFAAFKFVNNVFPDPCRWCKKYFERKSIESYTIYTDAAVHCFCSKTCMNVYISNSRHIVPCNWCKVKKYNFDMIKRTLDSGQSLMMCSLNCLTLYQVSMNAVSSRRTKCDQCKRLQQAQYHLTMSDATVRNFCSYQCVMLFQRQYSKSPMVLDGDSQSKQAVPTGAPRRTYAKVPMKVPTKGTSKATGRSGMPVISNVQSLAGPTVPAPSGHATRAKSKRLSLAQDDPPPPPPPPVEPPKPPTPPPPPPPKIYNHIVIKPAPPKEVRNISTLTKPLMVTKGVSCRPHPCSKEVQTDDHLEKRILIPIPVPIYVPTPIAMYSLPFPMPVPIPLPIPIPVFIPTTRNSASGIMKEIKKIHDKMPTDPFEAELLMMAEMVAGDKKKCESDSESDEENGNDGFSPDTLDTGNNAFGEDMLQMAFKMATEYSDTPVDLESAMTASTITPSSHPSLPTGLDENNPMHHHSLMMLEQQRAAAAATAAAANLNRKRARGGSSPVNAPVSTRSSKRSRRAPETPTAHHAPEPPREPQEKPDANMCLKYTFGVNAWKQWVVTKNSEMEKSTVRRKPFKSEILQLTADELNYSLCLFVKEVRKPNGSEYAPDTIYYLVLGIQQYLFENGRIDNIFTDSYYEKFTECLDEVARKFSVLYNDSQYIVTRVEEEHLWESKQLGAHSPHVLLSTLMFFNTKHFNLVTVEEHMQLSFSHIMKHWKRNPNQPGAAKIPGSRNVLLRFYPPQSALDANSRKKKVYEQQENEDNPLRCPVKLYEFYLSKCVKTRNDVFYLMPERSCVPDSPVWYSTQALGREPLSKMLHRVKMVKEINIALLTS